MASEGTSMISADCPRCGQVRSTFDVLAHVTAGRNKVSRDLFETFVNCRKCGKPSNMLLARASPTSGGPTSFVNTFLDGFFEQVRWVVALPSLRTPPAHVPEPIERIFKEAATCLSVQAWDASGTMYRKVLDAATRARTPTPDADVPLKPANWKIYRDLRLRLDWLFENKLLEPSLADLSSCIHQDGNDAAHALEGIGEHEAKDLADFTHIALETIYTIPGQIAENQRRRNARRGGS